MKRAILFTLIGLACASTVPAQFNPGVPQTGLNAAMMKLFGDINSFSSRANVRMLDQSGAESMSLPMTLAMLEGKVRAEVDLSQVKSKEMSPEIASSLKQLGMDKMVSIMRPDTKSVFYVYPSLQAYAETAMSKEDTGQTKSSINTTKLGDDTIDGHPCEKNKVTVTDENKHKTEAIVWNATDLKKFPIQMQIDQPDARVVMRYSDVKLAKPDAKQFEAPAGFKKYESVEKLMQETMMKMLGK